MQKYILPFMHYDLGGKKLLILLKINSFNHESFTISNLNANYERILEVLR
jgi:hypothetical protein